ncbi:MAG: glycosyltransferase family 2 protein [Bacteroidales bacterium]|nr:glycosyltransferase family 2 protein [Bacteroidales bacterium]
MRYKIAFVIPVHNRLQFTKECLKSLANQEDTLFFKSNNIRIIVVDDKSTDETVDWIQMNYPEVIVLHGDGNLWYSGGMNRGIKYALENLKCDFIMLWLNDNYPDQGYFDNLQGIVEKWDGKTLICSKILYRSQPDMIFGMGGTYNSKTGHKKLIGWREKDTPEYQKDLVVDCFSGQGVLIHKSIIEEVGYLDERNFPQYHADMDYSLRAGYKGYKNIVYHKLRLLNDAETSGIRQKQLKSIKGFITGLTSIRSKYNIRRNVKFYRIHSSSVFAYQSLVRKYYVYTGSFVKWKVLGLFGIRKDSDNTN